MSDGASPPARPAERAAAVRLLHAHVLYDAPAPSPGAAAHDIEIAVRISPDPVARAEAGIAPLRQALALEGQYTNHAAVVLDDIDDIVGVHIEHRRAYQLGRPDIQ